MPIRVRSRTVRLCSAGDTLSATKLIDVQFPTFLPNSKPFTRPFGKFLRKLLLTWWVLRVGTLCPSPHPLIHRPPTGVPSSTSRNRSTFIYKPHHGPAYFHALLRRTWLRYNLPEHILTVMKVEEGSQDRHVLPPDPCRRFGHSIHHFERNVGYVSASSKPIPFTHLIATDEVKTSNKQAAEKVPKIKATNGVVAPSPPLPKAWKKLRLMAPPLPT